ncbi:cardiolipin synthase [bacterium SCN 62-11]|nr:MAG: cardiolipin synthase [bacterium SCN 62-11]
MWWAILATVSHTIGIFSALHAILKCRTSEGAIAWGLSLVFCPYLAIPAYWAFGKDKFTGYVRRFKRHQAARRDEWLEQVREVGSAAEPLRPDLDQARVGYERLADFPLTYGNQVDLLIDGETAYDEMFKAIGRAQKYVLVEYFIILNDGIGNRFREALMERARAGVKVYLVYDEFGCLGTGRAFFQEMRDVGVEVVAFAPGGWTKGRLQINFRNHRKILVVDGQLAHVGGINIGDDTIGLSPFYGLWRDTNVSLTGPAVQGVQAVFCRDYYWASGGKTIPEIDWVPLPVPDGPDAAVYVAAGPADQTDTGTGIFLNSIHSARRRIWLATPYFLPTAPVMSALETAVLRGVEVKIIIPFKRDILLAYLAAFVYLPEALRCGIQIHRFKPGYTHQKVMLIDDELCWVGSSNMDARSMDLNFEGNLVVFGERFARTVEKMLKLDLERCERMKPEDCPNSLPFRFAVRFARLFENIL